MWPFIIIIFHPLFSYFSCFIKVPITKQKEIVDYVANIRKCANKLKEEGKMILDNAKREVEQMIIG